jgi:glycosyltransferase involved in cell wall biosynthesis
MTSLTCGAAIITYNGMKYLPEQLDSILAQTRAVSHIVISDDSSSDGTWDYVEKWAQQAPVRVTLIRNEPGLGLIKNFEQAVSLVEADIIFSTDQDDIWLPHKVETMMAVFETQPDVLLVHSDAILIDGSGKELGSTLLTELLVSERERHAVRSGKAFGIYARRNLVTGAAASFRKSLLELARPIPTILYHDAWLAFMASAIGKVHLIDAPTIKYRLHGNNMVGVNVGESKQSMLTKIRRFAWALNSTNSLEFSVERALSRRTELHTRLASHPGVAAPCMAIASEALAFAQRRKTLLNQRNALKRTVGVLGNASKGHYRKYSDMPLVEAVRDILNR